MPNKKYTQKSLLVKPTTTAPHSLSSTRTSSNGSNETAARSVNDRIRESRLAQFGDSRPQVVGPPTSLPPVVRAVLDISVPPPPIPRHNSRVRRRIPGPPPPRSWITGSKHASLSIEAGSMLSAGGPHRVMRHTSVLPGSGLPRNGSLLDLVMKSIAWNWSWHVEYDGSYLTELPVNLREVLLSYTHIYGHGELETNPLTFLFPNQLDREECGEVFRLDLGNAIGGWSSLRRIQKELDGVTAKAKPIFPGNIDSITIPESWDGEEVPQSFATPLASMNLSDGSRFRNLRHLSLAAVPGTTGSVASWQDLLSLAAKVNTIVSLSLAYWPLPTYTPNASAGYFKISDESQGSRPAVLYGGSDFYTTTDNNWREAAGILRSLSRTTYCLKWLDLTGCAEWYPALTWQPDEAHSMEQNLGPDWNGSWRGIEHLVLAVGWIPRRLPENKFDDSVPSLDEHHISDSTTWSGSVHRDRMTSQSPWDIEDERKKYRHKKEFEKYEELRNRAKSVARDLRMMRKEEGGKWIDVDFGGDSSALYNAETSPGS